MFSIRGYFEILLFDISRADLFRRQGYVDSMSGRRGDRSAGENDLY